MAANEISIRYGDIDLIARELESIRTMVESLGENGDFRYPDVSRLFGLDREYRRQVEKLGTVKQELGASAECLATLVGALDKVVVLCEEKERAVKMLLAQSSSPEGFDYDPPMSSASHADEYYAAVDQAKKDDEEARAKRESKMAFFAERFPAAYAAYMAKVHKGEEDEWLEQLKNSDDPEDRMLYEIIMEQRKLEEDAAKAAEKAAEALGGSGEPGKLGDKATLGGFGGKMDSDLGTGGGLGGFGSDLGSDLGGGGGGFGDFGSGWESEMLGDAIDTEELVGAGEALGDVVSGDNPVATGIGMDAVAGEADLDGESAGVLGQFGEKLGALASAYGLQAAAVAGAGVALYATREQTTEAVAHVAEFVSTRCKPFASDVMDQVSGAAKKTRVNLGNARSRVVSPKGGKEAGDLIA